MNREGGIAVADRGVVAPRRPDTGSVAWLRVSPASDGPGSRVALFESGADGTPICFRFASFKATGTDVPAGASYPLRAAIDALLDGGPERPVLMVAAAEELDRSAAAAVRVPVYRIPEHAAGSVMQAPSWAREPTAVAERTMRLLLTEARGLEPLCRVSAAAEAAFGDGRVRGMTTIPGFAVTVSLPLTETPPPDSGTPDLPERLRHILCPAPDLGGSPADGSGPLSWPAPLMPFQQEGVRALLDMEGLLLADDMGLGKTIQVIAALRIRRSRGALGRVLVVAPTSILDQWRREIARWAPELTAIVVRGSAAERAWKWRAAPDVTLTSYGVLRADAWRQEVRRAWDTVVADEAQRIKNRGVETSEAVKRLGRVRSWALTGTPVENREDELASVMEFVDHDGSVPLKRYAPGPALFARHRELQLRRRKSDVLEDLPDKLVTRRDIELSSGQRASYDRAERDGIVYLKALGGDVTIVHVLELITRLKQICNADPRTGDSSKLDDIAERLAALSGRGHKAVVFSQYVSATAGVGLASRRLAEFDPVVLTGDTPAPDRPALVDAFRTRPGHRALIVSLGVGGVGLNLQEASYVFHLDRWWNPAVEKQAEDRVHRIGQTVKVHVVKYMCVDTIEERIDRVLAKKQALFDQLIDDVTIDLSATLSREELLGLFGL